MLDARAATRAKRLRRAGLGALVAVAAFAIACAGAEAFLEWKYPLTRIPADAPLEAYFAALGAAEPDSDRALTMAIRGTDVPWGKGEGVFRVAILGESSSLGVPYVKTLAFGAFYVKGMAAVDPSRSREQMHLGENGRSSEGVVHFLDTAFDVSPDVLVVYSGHNEFTYRLTVASPFGRARVFPWTWLPRIEDALQKVKDDGAVRVRANALDKVPADQRAAVANVLAIYARGDRERYPWSNFPILERERALHAERYRRNLETIVKRARERGIPLVFVKPTSHTQCEPLASGERFDPEASRIYAEARRMLTSDPARARELYIAARDKDPAPVRMTTAHGRVFEDVMTAHGVPWVDADACARRAAGSEIVGDAAIVDFMHPRENVHAEIAVELAKKFGAMGLTGLDASDAAAEARFREACRAWRAGQLGEVELGDARGLHWFVMMYLVFGNPRAARERALTCAPEKRALDVTLMLDLAARWCGDASGAARELAAARARRPEWKAAIDAWCEATGAER